ncbi:MAG TPA: GDP-mannose 4,6-dehydratase [Casimicrobiaceae bacterium]|nr:GDP-mannose 4,6-dehydratase [Casimicrobiaceae bacterium]
MTGAHGFTGRHLTTALRAAGYEVIGLVESPPVASDEVCADLTDAAATARAVEEARPDRVIHLAAISFVAHDGVEAIYRTNVLGSLGLMQALALRSEAIRAVILASSANVYGNVGDGAIDESTLPAPLSHYAASKLAMEHMAATFRDLLPVVIVRPFNYTGPGQSEQFVVPKLVAHFRRRAKSIELGNLDVVREFTDVRAVCGAYLRLLACDDAIGETINICTGRGMALRDVIALLEGETGHRMEVHVNPRFVRASEVRCLVGSPRKLASLVGPVADSPLAVTLRDMVEAA